MDNKIDVSFIGKSQTSKGYLSDSNVIEGLYMFSIGSEEFVNDDQFVDSVKKIGKAHGVNLYFFTGTDYSLGDLVDYEGYEMDKEEKKLACQDHIKAQKMMKDVDNILKTFRER